MRESSVKSPSVIGLVLELLISCVFAWQAAVQSEGADMCECSDALPSALCVPACMDRLNAMLPVVDFTCVKWLKQNPKYGFTFNAALLRKVMKKWIWCFWRKAKNEIKTFYLWCFESRRVSMSNGCYSGWIICETKMTVYLDQLLVWLTITQQ